MVRFLLYPKISSLTCHKQFSDIQRFAYTNDNIEFVVAFFNLCVDFQKAKCRRIGENLLFCLLQGILLNIMPQGIESFSAPGLHVFFQSSRAHVNVNPYHHLSAFIKSARKTLDCAIYDLKHPDVVEDLKTAGGTINLRIA